ncbi:hypothetical protein TNCV_4965541 [Trichonephila clavipes]|nr:hypothetical protein TNCV_4965541 [Trichonephila clavipes]
MVLYTIPLAMGEVCLCKAKDGLWWSPWSPHMNTIVITAHIESRFVAEDDLVLYRSSLIPSCATQLQMKSSSVGVIGSTRDGAAISDVSQPGALLRFWKSQGPVVKVLSASGQRSLRQLVVSTRVRVV